MIQEKSCEGLKKEEEKELNRTIVEEAWENKDTEFLAEYYFNFKTSPKQAVLIRKIAFREVKRLSVCAMTRWGKSQAVAIGIALGFLYWEDTKALFLGPQREQAGILRDYLTDLVLACRILLDSSDLNAKGKEDRFGTEVSKNRVTFKSDNEYRIFSAHGDANAVMGFGIGKGGGIIIKDEATLISDEANAKIMRMLGDNYEKAMIIELFNPWERGSKAFEHWLDPEWDHFHVGWEDAVKDGRADPKLIEEMRKELTPLEFRVLYESEFPDEGSDSLYKLSKVEIARNSTIDLGKKFEELKAKNRTKDEDEEFKEFKKIISCDVADKGIDRTVIYSGFNFRGIYDVINCYSEAKSENQQIALRIINLIKNWVGRETECDVNVDCIGVGTGVVSRLREFVEEEGYDNVTINGCHFGTSAIDDERFSNKKAENYFRNSDLFNAEQIKIPSERQLINELCLMKWEFSSTAKIKIIDPDKSPDFSDALVYFTWREKPVSRLGMG